MNKKLLEELMDTCSYRGFSSEGDYDSQTRKRVNVICKYLLKEELKSKKHSHDRREDIKKLLEHMEIYEG